MTQTKCCYTCNCGKYSKYDLFCTLHEIQVCYDEYCKDYVGSAAADAPIWNPEKTLTFGE
jgi:hypothetical protein